MVVAAALAGLVLAPAASGQQIEKPFDQSYSLRAIDVPADVPLNRGGLVLKAGTTDRLLIGGGATAASRGLYEVGVVRDGSGHISGLTGPATRVIDAPYVDGGVAYGAGGVLFLSRSSFAQVGQVRPGSAVTDTVAPLGPPFSGSLGALMYVPPGLPGAGSLKLATYPAGSWYTADVVPDGAGTYGLSVAARPASDVAGGPEGLAAVTPSSPLFPAASVLVTEFGGGVSAYEVDAAGDPVGTGRRLLSGLSGAVGAHVDPLTGDYLLLGYHSPHRLIVVMGFARPATLEVRTRVVNDDGGTRAPGDFGITVRRGGIAVPGSPEPGTVYTLMPGVTHAVAVSELPGYTTAVSGDCAADGSVTPQPGVQRVCTVTADDVAPAPPLPPPEAGKTVNVLPQGTVQVKLPGRSRFRALTEGEQLPVGTIVDTLNGRVTLVAAGGQTADFYGGIFRIGQGKGARPLTTLTLVEALSCPKAGRAVAAARKKKRRLWGDGSGRFRTKGKHSAATVVGTKWLVEDRCTSTLTRVVRGRVSVRDFIKKKTVIVRAGKKYVARNRR